MKYFNFKHFCISFCMLLDINAFAYNAKINNIYYNFSGDQAEVTYYDGNFNSYSGSVVIPSSVNYSGKTYSVTSIGSSAFRDCSGLTSVSIPTSVTSIGTGAFINCTNFIAIKIPHSVKSLGNSAFEGCSDLTSVTFSGAYLESIGKYTFKDCIKLTSIYIGHNVSTIGEGAFYNCSSLTSITIPYSVTSIGNMAFNNCSNLNSITIGRQVKFTNNTNVFRGCPSLTTIQVDAGNTTYDSRNNCNAIIETETNKLITGCQNTIIPTSVTSIGTGAFSGCSNMTSITIPNSVTNIGASAFSGCSGLTSVAIPESVTTIGYSAFGSCTGLTSVTIPSSVTSIGDRAFQDCSSLTSINIPNSVTTIGDYTFLNCISMASITIGSKVSSIGSYAFKNTSIKKVIWLPSTPPDGYQNINGITNYVANDQYSILMNVKVYPYLSSMFEIDGVKYVPVSPSERTCDAIDCVYSTEGLNIGKTVTYRGIALTVNQINSYLCYGNKSIKNAIISYDGELPDYAFGECSAMQTIKLGQGITSINNSAFTNCSSIATIQIPKSVITIEDNAFNGCTNLRYILMNDGNVELNLGSNGSNPLFSDCPLDSVYIGRNITYSTSSDKGYSPFYRSTTLHSVMITVKETEISMYEFYGCTNLKNVIIGDGVTTIGDYAFSGCISLDYFSFGSSMKTIGIKAFSECSAITSLISKATTPPTCGSQAFDDINKWECNLYVPDGAIAAYQAADQWREFFFIQIDPDAIVEIKAEENDSEIARYDLQGRKVTNPRKGIYIEDGKKVLIK